MHWEPYLHLLSLHCHTSDHRLVVLAVDMLGAGIRSQDSSQGHWPSDTSVDENSLRDVEDSALSASTEHFHCLPFDSS